MDSLVCGGHFLHGGMGSETHLLVHKLERRCRGLVKQFTSYRPAVWHTLGRAVAHLRTESGAASEGDEALGEWELAG